jgi:hypothetical protein
MRDLTQSEVQIVGACLQCVAAGDVILDDWEFPVLFGVTFAEVEAIARAWPHVNVDDATVVLAVRNSLNNLLGYPHGHPEIWGTRIPAWPQDVERILVKLSGGGAAATPWHEAD